MTYIRSLKTSDQSPESRPASWRVDTVDSIDAYRPLGIQKKIEPKKIEFLGQKLIGELIRVVSSDRIQLGGDY